MAYARAFLFSDYRYKSDYGVRTARRPDGLRVRLSDNFVEGVFHVGGSEQVYSQLSDLVYTVSPRTKTARKERLGPFAGEPAGINCRFNDCRHNKYIQVYDVDQAYAPHERYLISDRANPLDPLSHTHKVIYFGSAEYTRNAHNLGVFHALSAIPNRNNRSGYTTPQLSDLCNQALLGLQPTLTVVEIGEDLITIRETGHLLSEAFRSAKNLPKSISRNKGKTLKLSRKYSQKVLAYNFAWLPLYRSLTGTVTGLNGMLERIRHWQEQVALGLPYYRNLRNVASIPGGLWTGDFRDGDNRIRWSISQSGSVGASLIYTPRPIEELNPLLDMFRAGLQTLGLKLNGKILWDLLPFSFVVDWFTNIGQVLDSISFESLVLPFEMLDFCLGFKEFLVITTTVDEGYYGSTGYEAPFTHASWQTTIKSFDRYVFNPFVLSRVHVDWHAPSLNHVVTGVHLANAVRPDGYTAKRAISSAADFFSNIRTYTD